MQVRWEYLTPPEFKKLVKEEQICILPLGILERHGEHLPYGTDGLSVHAIACRAAELEPCVVFPHLLVRPRARGVMLCGLRQLSPPAAVRDAGSAVGPDRPQRL